MTTCFPRSLTYAFFITLLASSTLLAQVSPEILEDGRVTFRCRAEHAKRVVASGQFGESVELKKGDSEVWSGTTSKPVDPGVYEYRLKIDGRDTIDSRNPNVKPQRWPNTSILHIPSTPPAHWDLQDIAHGTLHRHSYHSKTLDKWRELIVYTPPGRGSDDLPVLYLAHGYSDNQRTWTEHGKAHSILDSLIQRKVATPMIVVMSDAHAIPPGEKKFDAYAPKNTAAFCGELLDDIIPWVDSHYPTQSTRQGRAFAGLSMGGHHALTIALKHSDKFSHIGAFSAAPPIIPPLDEGTTNRINQNLKLLWVACGDRDFLFERNQAAHAKLTKLGVNMDYEVTPGADHSWPVWRNYLIDFVPMLFR